MILLGVLTVTCYFYTIVLSVLTVICCFMLPVLFTFYSGIYCMLLLGLLTAKL